jgi:iron-sulfur cluster assembly protein
MGSRARPPSPWRSAEVHSAPAMCSNGIPITSIPDVGSRKPSSVARRTAAALRSGWGLLPSKFDLESNHEEVSRPVLTLTSDAAEAVKTIAEASPELPNDSGLRIQAQATGEGQVSFDLAMVESPDEGDQVIEEAGARVFVEPDAALILADKILDATVAGNQVQFSLSEQD